MAGAAADDLSDNELELEWRLPSNASFFELSVETHLEKSIDRENALKRRVGIL